MVEIELSSLDLRYEGHRMKDRAGEARLLAMVAERGIAEPLEGVDEGERHVLLNGFKRWRCAHKLGLTSVPYVSLGEDAAMGIVALLRASNDRALGLLEQAGFVDELKRLHQMSVVEIAESLSRSIGWVSMRLGLLAGLLSRASTFFQRVKDLHDRCR
jgi:ParB-like chromosome segregation protein Spo0J